MKSIVAVFLSIYLIYLCRITIDGATNASDPIGDDVLSEEQHYCFEFTWFGPQYDNNSMYNGTCGDYIDETRATDVPCSAPIVITYDGSAPDIDYLWANHRTSVLCKKTGSEVCARYTFAYNGQVVNTTYMCTKAQVIGEGPVTTGCFKQKKEGYDMQVCICNSGQGVFLPCNYFRGFDDF